MVADLRKCCSEDDLSTVPWRFLLSFLPFLVLLYSFSKVQISPKVTIACCGFCLLRHTKTWLARDIINYSGAMFLHVLYAKQNTLGVKKVRGQSEATIWLYKRPKTLISSKAKKLNILLRILSLE